MRDTYTFTVIMAVRNADMCLNDAVKSIIQQDIGFEKHIQLVLIDDGSTDKTGSICDQYAADYPDNVEVIHQDHAGVSAARNAGLEKVKGDYVNFLDGNDVFSKETFSCAKAFFDNMGASTDVATVQRFLNGPKVKFGLPKYKTERKPIVISLTDSEQIPNGICLNVDSSFFRAHVFDKLRFNTALDVREDADVVLRILMDNPKLGILPTKCQFFFRAAGHPSMIQQPVNERKGYYLPYHVHFVDAICKAATDKFGNVPEFVQAYLLFDLQWHYKLPEEIKSKVLTAEEIAECNKWLEKHLEVFSDELILSQRFVPLDMRANMLSIKHRSSMIYNMQMESPSLCLRDGTEIRSMSTFRSVLEFMHTSGDDLIIEGLIRLPHDETIRHPEICLLANGKEIAVAECDFSVFSERKFLGKTSSVEPMFKFTVPLAQIAGKTDLQLNFKLDGIYAPMRRFRMGRFFPLTLNVKGGYCIINKQIVTIKRGCLRFRPYNILHHIWRESLFLLFLMSSGRAGALASAAIRALYWLTKPFIPKDIWLVSDRVNKADDNGEALFRYIVENNLHPHIYYVILKSSPDNAKLREVGNVINHLSLKHLIYHLNAQWIMSSSSNRHVTIYPKEVRGQYYQDILFNRRYAFLQHGITMNDVSNSIKRINTNMTMMVTSAPREYHSIVDNPAYNYGSDVIKLTGFPRYDRRTNEPENIIYVAPSWRSWLASSFAGFYKTGTINVNVEQFQKSEYCIFFSSLLKDQRMISAAKEYGYRIVFVPHPSMASCSDLIEVDDYVEYASADLTYNDIFRTGKLMVTDYSSVFMDFAYLNKPVLYTQFDKEKFFSHHYRIGYFSYEDDGFGEVEYDLDSTVERIIEYIRNDCKLKDMYQERIRKFFAFHDKNNCKRVYEELLKGIK